jgi:hypothetical protein
MELGALCFNELKWHDAGPFDVKACEAQALDACQRYLDCEDQAHVYAMTMFGTKARFWLYEKGDQHLSPLAAAGARYGYTEANSSEAIQITKAFERIKMEWVLPAPKAVSNKLSSVPEENIVRTQPNMPQPSDNPHLDWPQTSGELTFPPS